MGLETVLEGLVILALPWRFGRTVLTQGMRRKLMVFPRIGGTLLAGGCAAALVIALAARSQATWRILAALSLLALAVEAWRGRPSFGRNRRWPPGSLSLAPRSPWVDPDFYEKQRALHGPVFKFSNFVQPTVCIVNLRKARDLLRRYDEVLTVPPLPFDRFVPGRFIRYLDPLPHRTRSASIRAAVSRDVVIKAEPVIATIVREALADLAKNAADTPPSRPLEAMVFRGFVRLFFGFETGSASYERFETLMETIDYRRSFRVRPARLRDALEGVVTLLSKEEPRGFLGALAAADPAAARQPGILLNLLYVFNTSWTDVSGLMTWLIKTLAAHPEWLTRLREAEHPDEMAVRVVRETLRLSQSEYLTRCASEPLEIDGYVIPKGWLVRICIREIHRLGDAFEDPLRFDPDRFLNEPPDPQLYAPFGASRVQCLGNDITLTFGRLLALELARSYDLAVTADGPDEFGPFHWHPGAAFRVALAPRADAATH